MQCPVSPGFCPDTRCQGGECQRRGKVQQVAEGRRHGCHNRAPLAESYRAQDGWVQHQQGGEVIAAARMVQIPHRMSTDCRYSPPKGTDPGCDGCRWRTTA